MSFILSYLFSLEAVLFVSILCILLLTYQNYISRKGYVYNKTASEIRWRLTALILLFVFAFGFLFFHFYPPKVLNYYINANHHTLEHKGFAFNNSINLVSSSGYLCSDSSSSLTVTERNSQFIISGSTFSPIFTRDTNKKNETEEYNNLNLLNKIFNISTRSKPFYWLRNPIYNQTINSKIRFVFADSSTFEINNISYDEKTNFQYGITSNGRTYQFLLGKLRVGYPINDLLDPKKLKKEFKTLPYEIENIDKITSILKDCYFIRELHDAAEEATLKSRMFFYPSKSFFENRSQIQVIIDGNLVSPVSQLQNNIVLNQYDRFKIGIGENQSPDYYFNTISDTITNLVGFQHSFNEYFPQKFFLSSFNKNLEVGHFQNKFILSDPKDLLTQYPREGYLFEKINANVPSMQIKGMLSFINGSSTDSLNLKVHDYSLPAGRQEIIPKMNRLFALQSFTRNTPAWLFKISNLRHEGISDRLSSPFIIFIFLSFLFLILLWITNHYNPSHIEVVCYLIFLTFITVRLFLFWRIATFPPLENISKLNFDNFLGKGLKMIQLRDCFLNYQVITYEISILFLIIILYLKSTWASTHQQKLQSKLLKWNFFAKKDTYFGSISEKLGLNEPTKLIIIYMLSLLCCFALKSLNERLFAIIIPLLSYFYVIYHTISIKLNPVKFTPILHKKLYFIDKILRNFNPYIFILNTITFGYFIINDKGFGVLFLMYWLFSNLIINLLFSKYLRTLEQIVVGVISLSAITLLFIPTTFKLLIEWKIVIIGCLILFLSFIFLIIHYYLTPKLEDNNGFFLNKNFWTRSKKISYFLSILILIIGLFSFKDGINEGIENQIKFVKARAYVISEPIESLIQTQKFKTYELNRVVEAAKNQWLISKFNDEKMSGFTLIPHFDKGINHVTQTRDVVISRYINAEHSELSTILMVILILSLFLVILWNVKLKSERKKSIYPISYILYAISVFIFVYALFVWFTSTNRFVFFGQDFPWISILNMIGILLPTFLLIGIIIAVNKGGNTIISNNRDVIPLTLPWLTIIFFIPILLSFFLKKTFEDGFFNPNLSSTKEMVRELDDIFVEKQKDLDSLSLNKNQMIDSVIAQFTAVKLSKVQNNRIFDASIIDEFITNPSSRNDLKSAIQIINNINNTDSTYKLFFNSSYYFENAPYHIRKEWEGNLLASGVQSDSTANAIFYRLNEFPFQQVVQSKNLQNINTFGLEYLVLPPQWFFDGNKPKIIVNSNQDSQITLVKNDKKMRLGSGYFAKSIDYLDIISTIQNEQFLELSFSAKTSEYLAKNMKVNEKRRLVYPLKNNLIWAFNYANHLQQLLGNSDLNKNSVETTLDFKLNQDIQNINVDYFGNKRGKATDREEYAVMVADGDGKIRAMMDHAPPQYKRINPNDLAQIYETFRDFHFERNYSHTRDKIGSLNLSKLYFGPGSSIKPLIYAAITSQLPVKDEWESLVKRKVSGRAEDGVNLLNFGSKRINWKIPVRGDDIEESNTVRYLQQSDNFYHATLLHLGSHTREFYRQQNTFSLTKTLTRERSSNNLFPELSIGGNTYFFSPNDFPKSDVSKNSFYGNERSLLALGLLHNMGLPITETDNVDNIDLSFDGNLTLKNKRNNFSIHSNYSFPELSHFYQKERDKENWADNFNRGIRQSTMGADPIIVTPWKMTEMLGKLAGINAKYQLNIIDTVSTKRGSFNADSLGWENGSYTSFVKANIFKGMEAVITDGTAKGLNASLNQVLGEKKNDYFFYGKTGTPGSQKMQHKMMALIISKNDLTAPETNILTNKYYVIYFTQYHPKQEFNWIAKVVDKVMSSSTFINYMR